MENITTDTIVQIAYEELRRIDEQYKAPKAAAMKDGNKEAFYQLMMQEVSERNAIIQFMHRFGI